MKLICILCPKPKDITKSEVYNGFYALQKHQKQVHGNNFRQLVREAEAAIALEAQAAAAAEAELVREAEESLRVATAAALEGLVREAEIAKATEEAALEELVREAEVASLAASDATGHGGSS